jgi:hypothetical protein
MTRRRPREKVRALGTATRMLELRPCSLRHSRPEETFSNTARPQSPPRPLVGLSATGQLLVDIHIVHIIPACIDFRVAARLPAVLTVPESEESGIEIASGPAGSTLRFARPHGPSD